MKRRMSCRTLFLAFIGTWPQMGRRRAFAAGCFASPIIPAGQVGNDRPISIVTEVWTSTDLKTIVSSKRNDPRMGEQTFRLTNIVRAEPDPSLFAVPSDFKIIDGGPKTIIYRRNQ